MFHNIRFMLLQRVDGFYVFCDKETRVMYMRTFDGGVTVMVNKDGKPLLYEGELLPAEEL